MKQLLANALAGLVTGVCFAIGMALCYLAVVYFMYESPARSELEYVQLPEGVSVIEHSQVAGTPSLTIIGLLGNSSATEWLSVSVEAEVLAAGAKVNSCDTDVRGKFPPDTKRAFKIECYGVSSTNLPDAITYRVAVRSAGKRG